MPENIRIVTQEKFTKPFTPVSETVLAYLSRFRGVIAADQDILVIGVRASNLPPDLVENPRIVLWQSSEESRYIRSPLPPRVGGVVVLRWVTHSFERVVRTLAKQRGAVMTSVLTTGEARDLIEGALELPAVINAQIPPVEARVARALLRQANERKIEQAIAAGMNPPPVPAEEPVEPAAPERRMEEAIETAFVRILNKPDEERRGAARGVLRQFLLSHADLTAPPGPEATRLISLAHEAGIHTTRKSILTSMAALRERSEESEAAEPTSGLKASDQTTVAIAEALDALDKAAATLQQAFSAITAARAAIETVEKQVSSSVANAVSDAVLSALAEVTERFRR